VPEPLFRADTARDFVHERERCDLVEVQLVRREQDGPGGWTGREGDSAWWGDKPRAGVEVDEGPQRFGESQPLACCPRRPHLRIARSQGRNDDHDNHGDLRIDQIDQARTELTTVSKQTTYEDLKGWSQLRYANQPIVLSVRERSIRGLDSTAASIRRRWSVVL
jgi:hypothetical protein